MDRTDDIKCISWMPRNGLFRMYMPRDLLPDELEWLRDLAMLQFRTALAIAKKNAALRHGFDPIHLGC